MHKRSFAVLIAAAMLTGCAVKYEYAEQAAFDNTVYNRESAGIRLEDDFYGYCNFDFLYTNEIPSDMPEYSYGQLVGTNIDEILSDEILSIAGSDTAYPIGSDEQKIHCLCLQYLDGETRDEVGLAPLEKGFTAIEEAQTAAELVRTCGMLYTEYGVAVLPAVTVSQDHFDSSKYSVFFGQMQLFYSTDELLSGKDSAEELQRQMTELLEATGTDNADTLAYDTVTMLLDIAESTADLDGKPIEEKYNIRKPDELDPLIAEYIKKVGLSGHDMIVHDTEQLEKICSLMTDENIPLWKALAECELIYEYIDCLPRGYSDALDTEKKTDEEKAVNAVKTLLSGEVGNIYAKEYLDAETLSAAKQMSEDIITAYRKTIEDSPVLSDSDRAQCLAKLDNLTVNIGCPVEEYHSDSCVSGSLLESVVSIKSAAVKDNLSRIDSVPLPTDWYMQPQTVNALYRSQSNSITIPMAMFNAPYFDANADYFINLGGLGFVIAHEIGHAFDAGGILYDEYGNYRPERINSDRTKILSDEVADYFGSKQIMGTFYIDGERTKDENAADLGGMQVLASMTDNKDGLKRIFESYANIWATLSFDTEAASALTEDVHSPAEIRVNAVLSSVDKFYKVYGITENDGMYVPPEKRVRLW